MYPADLTIRPARPDDLARIEAIDRGSRGAPHWSTSVYRQILDLALPVPDPCANLHRTLLVVEARGDVVGFTVASATGPPSARAAELESIVVTPSHQRRGLATLLCRAVFAWAGHLHATTIDLEVRASSGAITLYTGLGFVPVGRRPAYYHAPTEDAVLMRWQAPPYGAILPTPHTPL